MEGRAKKILKKQREKIEKRKKKRKNRTKRFKGNKVNFKIDGRKTFLNKYK